MLAVVFRHGPQGRIVAHHNQHLSGTGQRRIQHAPHHQRGRRGHGCQHDTAILAALRLVDGLGIGQVHLVQHLNGIGCHPSVKIHGQPLTGGVDLHDPPHIAVEHSGSNGSVLFRPDYIVIISGLHDTVSLTEDPVTPQDFPFSGHSGIQCLLQQPVQIHGTRRTFAGGSQHLDLLRGDPHLLRQPSPA